MLFVADLEQQLDTDPAERSQPHCAAVRDLDDIAADLCNVAKHLGEAARAVWDEQFENNVASAVDETLLENSGEQD